MSISRTTLRSINFSVEYFLDSGRGALGLGHILYVSRHISIETALRPRSHNLRPPSYVSAIVRFDSRFESITFDSFAKSIMIDSF